MVEVDGEEAVVQVPSHHQMEPLDMEIMEVELALMVLVLLKDLVVAVVPVLRRLVMMVVQDNLSLHLPHHMYKMVFHLQIEPHLTLL